MLLAGAALGPSVDVAWQWAAAIPSVRAERVMVLVLSGETTAASAELDDLARDGFRQVTRDIGYLFTLGRLAQAAVALGRREVAAALYDRLLPYATFCAVNGMSLGIGSVAYYLGLLARYLEKPAEAHADLDELLRKHPAIDGPGYV